MKKGAFNRSENIHFYPLGLAGVDSDTDFKIGPVRTLKTLMTTSGDQNVSDYDDEVESTCTFVFNKYNIKCWIDRYKLTVMMNLQIET